MGRQLIRRCALVRSESGVMVLLTLVLCLLLIIPTVLLVWQIAYIQAAQSQLATTAVAAAYAATEETQFGSGTPTNDSNQLRFDCGPGFAEAAAQVADPHCTSGRTANAARALFSAQLQGQFGLVFRADGSGSVHLADENWQPLDGVLAYEITLPSGAAAQIADPGCTSAFQADPQSGARTRVCWINPTERNSQPQVKFNSGVIVNATAVVKLPQGCAGSWCLSYTIHVSESSGQGQQPTPSGYR
jgi:hypothetical protein